MFNSISLRKVLISEALKSDADLKTASEDLSAELGWYPKMGFLKGCQSIDSGKYNRLKTCDSSLLVQAWVVYRREKTRLYFRNKRFFQTFEPFCKAIFQFNKITANRPQAMAVSEFF